ncbi:lysozyme-like domain-containing protein [Choanephora cucurbitarum]|nr:lysozyme-like domain-containing protein [Choanephora cucurbitarum]
MAQLITNVFENGGKSMGYAAVQQLGDCRGYTAGYIGFTTGTNDAYYVVKEYVNRRPNATLKTYLPELHRLSQFLFGDPARDDISQLIGFPQAWKEASCHDPVFDQTQLDVGESMYMRPAIQYAASVGIHSHLGMAIFYDYKLKYVEPLINLPRIIQLTGPKGEKETEQAYLTRFLTTRRQLVCCYPSGVWNESADRMQDLQSIVDDWHQHQDLNHPVLLKIFNVEITGKEDITMDTEHCLIRSIKTKPASIRLPLPNTCNL